MKTCHCGEHLNASNRSGLCRRHNKQAQNRRYQLAKKATAPVKEDPPVQANELNYVDQEEPLGFKPTPATSHVHFTILEDLSRISKLTGKVSRMTLEIHPNGEVSVTDVSI